MDATVGLIVLFAAGAIIVTKTIDFIRELLDSNNRAPAWVWIGGAFLVGIAYAVGFEQNLSAQALALVPALEHTSVPVFWGEVATGLAFGAGADFWHKLLAKWSVNR